MRIPRSDLSLNWPDMWFRLCGGWIGYCPLQLLPKTNGDLTFPSISIFNLSEYAALLQKRTSSRKPTTPSYIRPSPPFSKRF